PLSGDRNCRGRYRIATLLRHHRRQRLKITSIDTIPVKVPIDPKRAIRGGRGVHAESPFLIVTIRTDEGVHGLGEVSCTAGWSGEDQVTAAHMIRTYLEPVLIGEDPTRIEHLTAKIR